jgi:hypothetical protein
MDGDDGLLVVGVDGLESLAFDALDELVVDEPACVGCQFEPLYDRGRERRETYKPSGCSYFRAGVVIS